MELVAQPPPTTDPERPTPGDTGFPQGSSPHGFTDVDAGSFYDRAVAWARHNGITTGIGGGPTFAPDEPAARAHTVTFLWRLAGRPT